MTNDTPARFRVLPVEPFDNRFYVRDTVPHESGGFRRVSAFVTNAEANVIAFALNTIANGHRLIDRTDGHAVPYTGPVDL